VGRRPRLRLGVWLLSAAFRPFDHTGAGVRRTGGSGPGVCLFNEREGVISVPKDSETGRRVFRERME
jgi:hypothetical protein